MSKSDPSEMSRIDLTDDPDTIRHKIRRAKTDSLPGMVFDVENRPERSNLLSIFSAVSGQSIERLSEDFEGKSTLEFKDALTDALVSYLSPISSELHRLLEEEEHIDALLRDGADKARERAAQTMRRVREMTGIVP